MEHTRDRAGPELTEAEIEALLTTPVDLPDGIPSFAHHCPVLEFARMPKPVATLTLDLRTSGQASCPHCGITVRSRQPALR